MGSGWDGRGRAKGDVLLWVHGVVRPFPVDDDLVPLLGGQECLSLREPALKSSLESVATVLVIGRGGVALIVRLPVFLVVIGIVLILNFVISASADLRNCG